MVDASGDANKDAYEKYAPSDVRMTFAEFRTQHKEAWKSFKGNFKLKVVPENCLPCKKHFDHLMKRLKGRLSPPLI